MDEGSALLHQLDRWLNRVLTTAVASGLNPETLEGCQQKDGTICVCGYEARLAHDVKSIVTSLLYKWHLNTELQTVDLVVLEEEQQDVVTRSKFVVLCVDLVSLADFRRLCSVIDLYRHVRKQRGKFLLVCVQPDVTTGSHDNMLKAACCQNPELRMIEHQRRLHVGQSVDDRIRLDLPLEDAICDWIKGQSKTEHEVIQHMCYSDISQVLAREFKKWLPDVNIFIRLLIMCICGSVSVLITLAFLLLVTKDAGLANDVVKFRAQMELHISGQRSDQCDWGWRDNAMAILALQINDPSWCFHSVDNQRSVDRLEISLLAVLSRLPSSKTTELTAQTLALYVNSLVATYHNPRDFHDHDLSAILDLYLARHVPYGEISTFSLASAVVALCNSGYSIREAYVDVLLSKQQEDGSYPLGADETAMVVMALVCAGGEREAVRSAIVDSLNNLLYQRRRDGSYGGLYTTALVLQAFTAAGAGLPLGHQDSSMEWMLKQIPGDMSLGSLDVAGHALVALAERSLLSAGNTTGLILPGADPNVQLSHTTGKYTDTFKYMMLDSVPVRDSDNALTVARNSYTARYVSRRRPRHLHHIQPTCTVLDLFLLQDKL